MLYSEVKHTESEGGFCMGYKIEAALSRHPKQHRRIIVTDSSLISLAAKGLDHEALTLARQ